MSRLKKFFMVFAFCMFWEGFTQTIDQKMENLGEGTGMTNIESVVFDSQNNYLYVSNGENFAPGIKGFISKFNMDGELVALKWVDHLSRPTGMAIHNNQLWVADVDQLKVIDISSGEVIKKYPEPIKNSGLNDVVINSKGEVYVTASFVHAVFKVEGDTLKLWVQDEKALQWANGIFATNEEIWVGGTLLSTIDIKTKEIREIASSPPIQDIDGLWPDGRDGFLLSTVESTSLWHLDNKGKSKLLHQGGDYFGDLQYIPEHAAIYVPRGNHKERQYYLAVFKLEGF